MPSRMRRTGPPPTPIRGAALTSRRTSDFFARERPTRRDYDPRTALADGPAEGGTPSCASDRAAMQDTSQPGQWHTSQRQRHTSQPGPWQLRPRRRPSEGDQPCALLSAPIRRGAAEGTGCRGASVVGTRGRGRRHYNGEPVDFPDVARAGVRPVRTGQADRGIMVCGTGIGAAMAANKLPGIRAALCHDVYSAHQCVEHDDANVFCLGRADRRGPPGARPAQGVPRRTFSTEEHFRRRVRMLAQMERDAAAGADEVARAEEPLPPTPPPCAGRGGTGLQKAPPPRDV